ncbi:MAG: sulfatase [Candidatus Omnitrophota bacterium]
MNSLNRRYFLKNIGYGAGAIAASGLLTDGLTFAEGKKPNFVILFADDMGYGDWSRGGNPTIRTPNLNRMADEGVQMTQFYCANPVCSPSRSALLTGRNPIRTGVVQVFFPGNGHGMSLQEITIAEALKPLGYASACIGKWHLGSTQEYRPLRQGFDYYYGILYSNDMVNPDIYRNDEMIEHPADQTTLTKRYTEEAVRFIEKSKDQPFLLYLPYTMPHVPIAASQDFLGQSRRGLFGDVIEEIDWSVGRINETLDNLGLSENTLVMFTSDNGPWMIKDQKGGSAGLLRGAKGDTWEGGMREPFVARWKGTLPAGRVCMDVGSTLDFFPTCVKLAGAEIPQDRPIDGIDLMPTLLGKESPERTIYFYRGEHLRAIRKGKWKLHFSYYDLDHYDFRLDDSKKGWITPEKPLLFDLEADPSERFDLASQFPEVAKDLTETAERYKEEIRKNGENQDLIDWFVKDWPTASRKGD